jgi:hypothetical protein
MKPVVEGMGLTWQGQHEKLNQNPERWGCKMVYLKSSGGNQAHLCMPLRKIPGWLSSIVPSRVAPAIRTAIEVYQNECDDVLWAHWDEKCARTSLRSMLNRFGEIGVDLGEDGSGYVYGIRNLDNAHLKIGFSNDPQRRLRDLQIANSGSLELVFAIKADEWMASEKAVHRALSDYHIRGEWFSPAAADDVQTVMRADPSLSAASEVVRAVEANRSQA